MIVASMATPTYALPRSTLVLLNRNGKAATMHAEDYFTRPLYERISKLEGILRDSPCHLMVKHSDGVMELVGYGDRVMALEDKRLRDALTKIADGTIADTEIPAFAWATLDP